MSYSHVRIVLPVLNQYYAEDKVSCSRTQRAESQEPWFCVECLAQTLICGHTKLLLMLCPGSNCFVSELHEKLSRFLKENNSKTEEI